jgi:chemotaxis protein histidine kinase CheA
MMTDKFLEFIDKILDEPMKALVVVAGVVSYLVVKKYSSLLDKTFEIFDTHRLDMKESFKSVKDEMTSAKDELVRVKTDLINQITNMRQEILLLNDRLHEYSETHLKEFGKVKVIEDGLKETYGKVIILEKNLDSTENKLNKTREQLRETVLILQKHKEKISKLP